MSSALGPPAIPPAARGGRLPLELERGRLDLPGGGRLDGIPATQEHQVLVVRIGRLPLVEPHPVAPLAEIVAGHPAREPAVRAPSDVAAMVDEQREAPDPGRGARRQVGQGRDAVAPIGSGLHDHLARAGRTHQPQPALEGPGPGHGGPAHRAVGLGVEHLSIEGTQQITGPQRIRALGEGRPLDDGGASQDRADGHRHARGAGAAPLDDVRACGYSLKHGGRSGSAAPGRSEASPAC
jgi:hypothetical protein